LSKKVVHATSDGISQFGYIEEEDTHYKEHLLYLKGNYYISGWFQNEKYFKDHETTIKKELYPKRKIKISKELKHILDNKNTVSVHVRRGDYRQLNNLVKVEYYKKAMELINSYLDNVFYIVFSDDLDWVSQHMHLCDNVYFMNQEYGMQDYEELFVMSRCKHNIIANSTFSWWGAWLNDNKSKIIIGPKKWFANNKLNIMPDEWIKL
ncbi:MAG: alpha-1,2-fucosyltransferase, partial [Lachnospiraceae bacterium]|nr:alpha-1,2-fucosyltransferase [Lachnospiraceae bacterium]